MRTKKKMPARSTHLCVYCGGPSKLKVCFQREQVEVLQCTHCDLAFLWPQLNLEEVHRIYTGGEYYSENGSGYDDYSGQENSLRITFQKLLKRKVLQEYFGGSLLEVGCGYGYFLDEASTKFENVQGTELDQNAITQARKLDLSVKETSLENLESANYWDVVIMIQVIEHIHDPAQAIRKMKTLLSPNGALVLVTPDFSSPLRYLLGRKWPSYKIPEHLYYFNKKSMTLFLQDAGLSEITWIRYPHAFPLDLIARKFKLNLPKRLGEIPVWIPRTSIAVVAKNI